MDISQIHNLFLECSSVSTDTRRIESNCLFFALKGENFDANTFAREALAKGAAYVVIDNSDYFIDKKTILVDDSLLALQQLAAYHRTYLKIPIIALTGSNGKTTTKELIYAVLSQKYRAKATIGNLNNHIGVPLTLLSFTSETEIGIVEMGANHKKEIAFLCGLARPDFGYITNFGKAHLEGFGGFEGVIQGKSEMYDYLLENDKRAFVNLDDAIQVEKTKDIKHFSFGIANQEADVVVKSVEANPFVIINYDKLVIKTHLIGLYNANNTNVALTIGKYFKVDDQAIKKALENYIPQDNRSQLITKGSNQIILDAYNANPSSMAVAIKNFIQLEGQQKIMILGDMFELGLESLGEHQKIISDLIDHKGIICYFIGADFFANRLEKEHFYFYESFASFSYSIQKESFRDSKILIKGSRGMALERVLDII